MMGYIYRFNLIVVTLLLFLTFWLLTADIHHAMVSLILWVGGTMHQSLTTTTTNSPTHSLFQAFRLWSAAESHFLLLLN